jgi:hypothetical protein
VPNRTSRSHSVSLDLNCTCTGKKTPVSRPAMLNSRVPEGFDESMRSICHSSVCALLLWWCSPSHDAMSGAAVVPLRAHSRHRTRCRQHTAAAARESRRHIQWDGDDDIAQLQGWCLQRVLHVHVDHAATHLLRPAVDCTHAHTQTTRQLSSSPRWARRTQNTQAVLVSGTRLSSLCCDRQRSRPMADPAA